MPNKPRFAIEPQRDMGSPTGEDATWFVKCEPEDAEQWSVFSLATVDPDLLADFATEAEARALVAELETARAGDVYQTPEGWFVVADSVRFSADGPFTESEARAHGDSFA